MKTTGILLVGYGGIDAKIAGEIARMAFPGATVKTAMSLDDAVASAPISDTDLLVLQNPPTAAVVKAMNVVDSLGLPRWAVVAFGSDSIPLGAESIASDEWGGPVTAHAFRSAIAQYELRRELVRAKGDLATIGIRIAHDLRTQVAGILATTELTRELLNEIEPEQPELLQPIFDSVDELGKLIERISLLTKISATGAEKKPLCMKEAIDGALARLNPDIAGRKASLSQPPQWPRVNGSRPALETIWVNLIGNALVHAGDAPRIEVGWRMEKQEYHFWIRDSGRSIAAPARRQLFRPFHLLYQKGSPRGLGLPAIQRLVHLHGGRCGYEPSPRGGSEFYFTIPI